MVNEISLDYFKQSPDRKYHIHRISGSDVSGSAHTHSYYQICYVDRGEIQHWTGDSCVTLYYGEAFIVPPGFVHRIVFPNQDSQIYSLSFDESMFHPTFHHSGVSRFLAALKLDAAEEDRLNVRMKVILNKDQRHIMQCLMESMMCESTSVCPAELSSASSLISAIFCILSQAYFMDEQRCGAYHMVSHYNQSLQACVEYIDTHFSLPLTLEYLTAKYAFSKSVFSMLFPQYVGMTLKRYINKKRIEHAVVLMQNRELTLAEIAAMTGYDEFSTFYRNFKRIIGVSPSDYRATALGETDIPT